MRAATVGLALATVVCGIALHAQLRMLTPVEMNARLADAAVEAAQRPVVPIPLASGQNRVVGAIYDRFLQGAAAARARVAAGATASPAEIAAHPVWQRRLTVVVAHPIGCDGRPNQPLAIRFGRGMGPVVPEIDGEPVRGRDAASLLPGVTLPDEALVTAFRNAFLLTTAVEIDYATPFCGGASRTAVLSVQSPLLRELLMDFTGVKLPEEFASLPSPTTVRLQALLDHEGRVRFTHQVQGPSELGPTAAALLTGRRFEPVRVNGIATADFHLVPIVFTATGARAQPAPFVPPGIPPGGIRTTSSLVTVPGGRSAPPPPASPVPPAPPGVIPAMQARLAIELAQKRDPQPIPLDAAGPPVHGVVYDPFLLAAQKARGLLAGGTALDPESPPPTLMRPTFVVVAYPLTCGERRVMPTDIRMAPAGGTTPRIYPPLGPPLAGDDLTAELPGAPLPAGALGRRFGNPAFSLGLEVTVAYDGPACPGESTHATLPLQWTRGNSIGRDAFAKLPDGSSLPSPTVVRLRGLVDPDGRYRFASLAEGAAELGPAAIEMTDRWRWQPYRVNGTPVVTSVIANVTFTTTGEPPAPGTRGSTPPPVAGRGAPPAAAPPAPTLPGTPPPLVTSSTIGGRPSFESTSPDAPGLSASTSRCPIADDATYGLTAGNAIKVGGGPFDGVSRQRMLIAALRGPSGQGLRVVRLGTTMGPGESLVDVYEVHAAHLTERLFLYLDSYHEDALKAPKGLTCASPLR
jgi:hypothetical protein